MIIDILILVLIAVFILAICTGLFEDLRSIYTNSGSLVQVQALQEQLPTK